MKKRFKVVVELNKYRKDTPTEALNRILKSPPLIGDAECLNCKHEWPGVCSAGEVFFKCPLCGLKKGVFKHPGEGEMGEVIKLPSAMKEIEAKLIFEDDLFVIGLGFYEKDHILIIKCKPEGVSFHLNIRKKTDEAMDKF